MHDSGRMGHARNSRDSQARLKLFFKTEIVIPLKRFNVILSPRLNVRFQETFLALEFVSFRSSSPMTTSAIAKHFFYCILIEKYRLVVVALPAHSFSISDFGFWFILFSFFSSLDFETKQLETIELLFLIGDFNFNWNL